MKIRIKLTDYGEWSDCWLQTEYMGKGNETYRCFIYPTIWSELYRTDGFVQYNWCSKEFPIRLENFIKNSIESLKLKQEQNDRHLTKMQKTCNFFKRLFAW